MSGLVYRLVDDETVRLVACLTLERVQGQKKQQAAQRARDDSVWVHVVFGILPPEKAGENVADSPQSEPQSPNELPTGSLKKPLRASSPAPSSRIPHVTPRLSAQPAPTLPRRAAP